MCKLVSGNEFFRFLLTCLLFTFVFSVVVAQKEVRPADAEPKAFAFPKQETYTLRNGMSVTLVQYGTDAKVAMQTVIRVGSINESGDKPWISDMVATLLKERTSSRSASQIALETTEMGGSIFTSAGTDKTIIGGEVLSEFETRFLNLLADVVLNPKFAAEDIEKIRENKICELAINRVQPGSLAWEKFRQNVFPNHAYGKVFPTEQGLKDYTLQDVKTFYYNQFGAARAHLYVVGQFDSAKVKAAIDKAFGNWKKGPEPIRDVPRINARRSLDVIDRPGATQSTIYLGMPTMSPSDPDFVKFTVMDSLLGSSPGSRITSNIAKNKRYTYAANSQIFNRYKTGHWIESAEVRTDATGAAVKEILSEIERLRKNLPSDAELQAIKDYLIAIYVLQNGDRSAVIGQLEYVDYNDLGRDYLDNYISNLNAVSATDISEMARKYLVTDKMTIVVVGDKAKITEQLKPYAN